MVPFGTSSPYQDIGRTRMQGLWLTLLVSIGLSALWLGPAVATGRPQQGQEATASPAAKERTTAPDDGAGRVVYRLDFSDYGGGSVEAWLESKGFKLKEAAKHQDQLELSIENGALILTAKEQLRGFVYNDSLDIGKFSKVRIEWGVIKFPEGASYERHVRNEALMVYISFGHETIASGNIILPDVPYFIGFFLCKDDKLNTPYIGKYYHEGGRFVCLGHPQPNETIVSEFDLVTAFRAYYEKNEVPPISGVNFGVDTADAGDGGKAAAFVKKIEILE
jgi:hypothetical protein